MFHFLTPKSGFFTNGASGGKPGTPACAAKDDDGLRDQGASCLPIASR
jgi:hypothetical protein